MLAGEAADGLVRGAQSFREREFGILSRAAHIGGSNYVNRNSTGEFAAFISAHAIGHNHQPALGLELFVALRLGIAVGILVVVANAPNVGEVPKFYSRPDSHGLSDHDCPTTSNAHESPRGARRGHKHLNLRTSSPARITSLSFSSSRAMAVAPSFKNVPLLESRSIRKNLPSL